MSATQVQRGFIAFMVVVVIAMIAAFVVVSTSLTGTGTLLGAYTTTRSEKSLSTADACFEEALLRLKRNSSYTGGTYTIHTIPCTIVVRAVGNTRTILTQATTSGVVRTLVGSSTVSGSSVTLDAWGEAVY